MRQENTNQDKHHSPDYLEREKRVKNAIALEKPDRVPIVSLADRFMTHFAGLTEKEAMFDYEKFAMAWLDSTIKLNFDMAPSPYARMSGKLLELMGVKTINWPGGQLADDCQFQYVESEILAENEFNELLSNPGDFTLRKILPRMSETLNPLSMTPFLHSFAYGYSTAASIPAILGAPPVMDMLKRLIQVGEESNRFNSIIGRLSDDLADKSYPMAYGAIGLCPYDFVADFLRGMKGSMLDLFKRPEKLKAAVELFTPLAIGNAIYMAQLNRNSRVFIPLHKGADGFMSGEHFKEFYWPGLKALLLALINAGLTPLPFFEGAYTSRLEFLRELPKGKILAHMDRVDIDKFKKVLGDRICFWGNVPGSMLIAGAEDQTRDYVKKLIDTFGDTCGLIVDGSTEGIPAQAKIENVMAMIETVHDYGKY
jgi:hypothetical protein